MGLLLRLLFGRPRCCRSHSRSRRCGILRWGVSLAAEEIVPDDVVHDLFQKLPDQHTHCGLAEPGTFIAVMAWAASSSLIVAVPAVAPATLRLPLLWIPVCCAPQRLLSETPGDIAPFASWSQAGPCLPWSRATGRDVWVLRSHDLARYIEQSWPLICCRHKWVVLAGETCLSLCIGARQEMMLS